MLGSSRYDGKQKPAGIKRQAPVGAERLGGLAMQTVASTQWDVKIN